MIIKKITIKRFRAIKEEKTLEFSSGLNIIKGSDNEAGKSSLRMAITKALFQDPTSRKKEVESLTSWGTDEPWEIRMEFADKSDSYTLIKSFKDKTCELVGNGGHTFTSKNKDAVSKKIIELTGCPTEIFFESTSCIGQEELIRLIPEDTSDTERQSAVGSITKKLQSKFRGAENANLPNLLAKLYHKTHDIDAEGPYAQLQRITERISILRGQKQDQESKNADILEKRRKLTQSREELEKIDPDLLEKQEHRLKSKRIIELQKEIERDKDLYDNFQRARELKSKIDRLENELIPLTSFDGADERIKEIDAIKSRLDEIPEKRLELKEELESLEKHKPRPALPLSGTALIAVGLLALLANPFTWIIAVAGLLPIGYWGISRRTWKTQIGSVSEKLDRLEKAARKYESEMQDLLKEFGRQNYEEYVESLARFRKKTAIKRDLSNQLEALIAGKEWKVFFEEKADLNIRISSGIQELEQLKSFRLDPLALQKLEQDIIEIESRKFELEKEKGALEKFFLYLDTEKDRSTEIEESLTALEEEKTFWENQIKIYDMTREMLELAYKQTLSRAADLLEQEISRYAAMVTDGKYNRIALSKTDLSIRTFSPVKNDWVEVEELSRGTQDQIYICARLALTRIITDGKSPPILLDDPFINFHSKRLQKMMVLLQEIARDTQVLLFTCSDSYDYLGKVISVG